MKNQNSNYNILIGIIITLVIIFIFSNIITGRELLTYNSAVLGAFLLGLIIGIGKLELFDKHPAGSLLKGLIFGIFAVCVTSCVYILLPLSLEPIIPIVLFIFVVWTGYNLFSKGEVTLNL